MKNVKDQSLSRREWLRMVGMSTATLAMTPFVTPSSPQAVAVSTDQSMAQAGTLRLPISLDSRKRTEALLRREFNGTDSAYITVTGIGGVRLIRRKTDV